MLKLGSKIFNLPQMLQKPPCVLCIRCYRPRKPFWLPTAKSKMFRIHKKPVIPVEDDLELCRLINVYRTNMKSLRQYFKEQLLAQTTAPEVIADRKQKEVEHHDICIKENDLWNNEVAKLREERLAKEAVKREEKILQKIITHEKEQKVLMEQIDSRIREEKEASKLFILSENIDEAIENALTNVVDHNFAIDLAGNMYKGRYGKSPPNVKTLTTSIKSSEKGNPVPAEARN